MTKTKILNIIAESIWISDGTLLGKMEVSYSWSEAKKKSKHSLAVTKTQRQAKAVLQTLIETGILEITDV